MNDGDSAEAVPEATPHATQSTGFCMPKPIINWEMAREEAAKDEAKLTRWREARKQAREECKQ